jgi:DNA invertase Pin-like site-specific DNA recombinase
MKAIIYARCSTDESKQDTEIQLNELRRYCKAYDWQYDEVSEYGSGYKADNQPKLSEVLEKIRLKHYDVLIVYSMDRFSRQSPSKINALLDIIVEQHKCRFIALQQGIDSNNDMTWHVVKPLFTYFANKYSKDLGEKVKKGIERKKELGKYNGGRPQKRVDVKNIIKLRNAGLSFRDIANTLNREGSRVSFQTVRRLLQKTSNKLVCKSISN